MLKRILVLLVALMSFAVAVVPATPAEALTTSEVAELQRWLISKGFLRDVADGRYGPKTSQAVMAFRKEIGAYRSYSWHSSLWDELKAYRQPYTRFTEPDRLEVNLTRQVAYLYRGGALQGVFPIASGNGETFLNLYGNPVQAYTPTGSYRFYLHRDPAETGGWHESYLGFLYKPWYFSGGFAIHGSNSVPSEPASHGCVRLTVWDADWLQSRLYVGMPIHIWHEPAGVGPLIGPPPPPPGPYADVPLANPFSADIGWLKAQGITKGCSDDGTQFCPTGMVTRGEMAAFLRRLYSYPYTALDFFWDDDGSFFEWDINALGAAGVAVACNPPLDDGYCPDAALRRDEFAAFLTRALDLPPTATDYFADDAGNRFQADINALAAAGITKGCSTGYCAADPITREEMAALLHRADQYQP